MTRFLLDTNVFSEVTRAKRDPGVVAKLAMYRGVCAISAVSVFEMRRGIESLPLGARRAEFERVLRHAMEAEFPVLPYDANAAHWHAKTHVALKQAGRAVSMADLQIAAIAVARNLVLVTRNVRDFEHFPDLHVINWFTS